MLLSSSAETARGADYGRADSISDEQAHWLSTVASPVGIIEAGNTSLAYMRAARVADIISLALDKAVIICNGEAVFDGSSPYYIAAKTIEANKLFHERSFG